MIDIQRLSVVGLAGEGDPDSDRVSVSGHFQGAGIAADSIVAFFCSPPVDIIGIFRGADFCDGAGGGDSGGLTIDKTGDRSLAAGQRPTVIFFFRGTGGDGGCRRRYCQGADSLFKNIVFLFCTSPVDG